jgi:hypothetical protein
VVLFFSKKAFRGSCSLDYQNPCETVSDQKEIFNLGGGLTGLVAILLTAAGHRVKPLNDSGSGLSKLSKGRISVYFWWTLIFYQDEKIDVGEKPYG